VQVGFPPPLRRGYNLGMREETPARPFRWRTVIASALLMVVGGSIAIGLLLPPDQRADAIRAFALCVVIVVGLLFPLRGSPRK
jgi:hypothetical protein